MNPSEIARSLEAGVAESQMGGEVIEVTLNTSCLSCGFPGPRVLCEPCVEIATRRQAVRASRLASPWDTIEPRTVTVGFWCRGCEGWLNAFLDTPDVQCECGWEYTLDTGRGPTVEVVSGPA